MWCHDLFEPLGVHSLQLIKCRAISLVCSDSGVVPGESVLLVWSCIE